MKTRLLIDRHLKRKNSPNKKLLMIDRKKQKTKHSSTIGNHAGSSKKLNLQNVGDVGDGGKILISELLEKGTPDSRTFATDRKSKRKLPSILKNRIRGRKRRKMEKVGKVDEAAGCIDKISELPEPIIHHILSFLRCPRDVARTSVLSKRWRNIWASFFTFDFDQKRFQTQERDRNKKFITFVDNSIVTKLEPMHSIQKFKLSLARTDTELELHMNNWISAATGKNVKELEIHVEVKKMRLYTLPNLVLTAKTLSSLKLYGCKFDSMCVIDMCHLKELSIKKTTVNTHVIQSFIQGCPLVEDLRLIYCTGLGHLHISTLHKLSKVELHECHGLVTVNIELPSLKSFLYCGKKSWQCIIDLTGCENLKYLTMKDSNLTDKLFKDHLTKFPSLEKVVLRECHELQRIFILSLKLKELSVIRCKKLEEANIFVPTLSALEFAGNNIPFSYMHIAGLGEAKLHMENSSKNNSRLFHDLRIFLRNFENNGAWKLVVSSYKNITIHEEWSRIRFPSNDFKLELTKSSEKLKDYVDNLLRMSHPKTVSLMSSSGSEFLKFVKRKIMSREENPKCCAYYSKKCWLHYVKDVTMEVLEGVEHGETSKILQQTTFKFNWKPVSLQH